VCEREGVRECEKSECETSECVCERVALCVREEVRACEKVGV